jgi:hypothetical protein
VRERPTLAIGPEGAAGAFSQNGWDHLGLLVESLVSAGGEARLDQL